MDKPLSTISKTSFIFIDLFIFLLIIIFDISNNQNDKFFKQVNNHEICTFFDEIFIYAKYV